MTRNARLSSSSLSLVASLMILEGVVGCSSPASPEPVSKLQVVSMKIGTKTYNLEIAKDNDARMTGLMHRKTMPENHGMIFVFAEPQPLGFWMKNTLIPLDIIYLDQNCTVVSIHRMEPLDERSVNSKGPAKYAIELNADQAKTTGIKEGDVLVVPAMALTTDR